MDKIIDIIEKEGIFLAYYNLRSVGDVLGLYTIHPKAGPMILLDKSLLHKPKAHRCIVAHELGHHFHPPRSGIIAFHCSNQFTDGQKEITIHQDENKALRWATELLMPSDEVWKAIRDGCDTIPLLADCFNVTEWFTRAKIGYIRTEERSAGIKLRWRDIISNQTNYHYRQWKCSYLRQGGKGSI